MKELLLIIASRAVTEPDDTASEVSSKNLTLPRSEASIATGIEDMVRTIATEVAPMTDAPIESMANQVPEGAISTVDDAPNPQV